MDTETTKKTENKSERRKAWGKKAVSRKFLILTLALAVVANAAVTAAAMNLFISKSKADTSEAQGGGRNRGGYYMDDNGSGRKMPPGDRQNHQGKQNRQGSRQQSNGQGGQSLTDGQNGTQQESKASIGIVIREDSGVYIVQVSGDNAAKAGFAEGDKIVSINGKEVSSSNDLISEVQSCKAGDKVTIKIERDGQPMEITTVLE